MSGLMDKAKSAMGSSSGGNKGGSGQEDYVDKGLDQAEKRTGMPQNRQANEKITDQGREMYEKQTGSKVNSKVC